MAGLSTNTRDFWSSLWIFCRHARGKFDGSAAKVTGSRERCEIEVWLRYPRRWIARNWYERLGRELSSLDIKIKRFNQSVNTREFVCATEIVISLINRSFQLRYNERHVNYRFSFAEVLWISFYLIFLIRVKYIVIFYIYSILRVIFVKDFEII